MDWTKRRSLLVLFFTFALDYFGFALVFALFGPLILSPERGMLAETTSPAFRTICLGILFAAFPLSQFFGAPFFGSLADRKGRKKTLCTSTLGQALGYLLSGFAIWFQSFPLLISSRMMTGFFSGNRCICMAAISDLSPSEIARSKHYGWLGTLGGVSWIASMLASGLFQSFAIPFWISSALCLLNSLLLWSYMTETFEKASIPRGNPFRHLSLCFFKPGRRSLYIFYLLFMIGWGINLFWLSPYVLILFKLPHLSVLSLLIATGLAWAFSSSLINGFLLKRWPIQKVSNLGLIGLTIVFTSCSLITSLPLFILSTLFASLFGALVWSNSLSLISLSSPQDDQGKTMGLSQSVGSLSLLLAPLVASTLAATHIRTVFPVATALIILSLLMLKKRSQVEALS